MPAKGLPDIVVEEYSVGWAGRWWRRVCVGLRAGKSIGGAIHGCIVIKYVQYAHMYNGMLYMLPYT